MSEVFIFAEHLSLVSKIWPFGSEVLKIQVVFFPPLPLSEEKTEMLYGEGGGNKESG